MALDFPAMGQALWACSDTTGVRPEWLLPVLWLESGFNPASVNSIGCTGINQLCQNIPGGYTSWSASQQMNGIVTPMFKSIVAKYGQLRSATRAYQGNLLPASLATATRLQDVIAAKGSQKTIGGLTQAAIYSANAGLDANGDGYITVQDLADKMAQMYAKPQVQSAVAQTYALRPGDSPQDAVYGADFPLWSRIPTAQKLLGASAILVAAAGGLALARPDLLHRIREAL